MTLLGDAIIVDEYRYRLTRHLTRDIGEGRGTINWIMLNPSTADATQDDPTIRRCIAFSRSWHFEWMIVTNLWALRATNPDELTKAEDPVGPRNMQHLYMAMEESEFIVAAWGAIVETVMRAGKPRIHVETLLPKSKVLWCLGRTKAGHPRHPLYVSGDTKPELFK